MAKISQVIAALQGKQRQLGDVEVLVPPGSDQGGIPATTMWGAEKGVTITGARLTSEQQAGMRERFAVMISEEYPVQNRGSVG